MGTYDAYVTSSRHPPPAWNDGRRGGATSREIGIGCGRGNNLSRDSRSVGKNLRTDSGSGRIPEDEPAGLLCSSPGAAARRSGCGRGERDHPTSNVLGPSGGNGAGRWTSHPGSRFSQRILDGLVAGSDEPCPRIVDLDDPRRNPRDPRINAQRTLDPPRSSIGNAATELVSAGESRPTGRAGFRTSFSPLSQQSAGVDSSGRIRINQLGGHHPVGPHAGGKFRERYGIQSDSPVDCGSRRTERLSTTASTRGPTDADHVAPSGRQL